MAGGLILGSIAWPVNWGLVYLGLIFQAAFGYATALLVASASEYSDIVERSVSILGYLAIPFSGAFSMVDWVSPSFQTVLLWSPSVNNVELIRAGVFGASAHAHYDLVYDTWMTSLLTVIGLFLTLRVRGRILVQ